METQGDHALANELENNEPESNGSEMPIKQKRRLNLLSQKSLVKIKIRLNNKSEEPSESMPG